MKKFICSVMILAIMILPNICGAVEISETTYNGNFELKYPEIKMSNTVIAGKINQVIREEIKNFIVAAREPNPSVTAATSYKIPLDNGKILSILLTEYVNYEGAAHPLTFMRALNFDLTKGTLINVADIEKYAKKKISPKELTKKLKAYAKREDFMLFSDFKELEKLPEDFYFDEKLHLHFLFQQYEVAPYAVGIIDVDTSL